MTNVTRILSTHTDLGVVIFARLSRAFAMQHQLVPGFVSTVRKSSNRFSYDTILHAKHKLWLAGKQIKKTKHDLFFAHC
jgi:hypothetical protein